MGHHACAVKHNTFERRASERFKTALDGRIVSLDGRMSTACIVLDLSTMGARIMLTDPAEVPVEFELHIPSEDATARACLVWSNGKEFGVRFTD